MNEFKMQHHEPLDLTASPNDVDHLLAEMERVFAEVVAGAESRTELTDEQREQVQRVIRDTMESTRRMLESLTPSK